jgi:hypothetical protein
MLQLFHVFKLIIASQSETVAFVFGLPIGVAGALALPQR